MLYTEKAFEMLLPEIEKIKSSYKNQSILEVSLKQNYRKIVFVTKNIDNINPYKLSNEAIYWLSGAAEKLPKSVQITKQQIL